MECGDHQLKAPTLLYVDASWHVIEPKCEPNSIFTLVIKLLHIFLPHVDIDIEETNFETVSYA